MFCRRDLAPFGLRFTDESPDQGVRRAGTTTPWMAGLLYHFEGRRPEKGSAGGDSSGGPLPASDLLSAAASSRPYNRIVGWPSDGANVGRPESSGNLPHVKKNLVPLS